MANLRKAMANLHQKLSKHQQIDTIPFEEFVKLMVANPSGIIRNVFQVFHDMIKDYVGEGYDEYPDDPESIHYVDYDCSQLLVEGTDRPFFADRLFANRFINHVEALKIGAQQNKIYIFEGPHGSGKSTFTSRCIYIFDTHHDKTEFSSFVPDLWSVGSIRFLLRKGSRLNGTKSYNCRCCIGSSRRSDISCILRYFRND